VLRALPADKRNFAYRPWHYLVNVLAASRLIVDERRRSLYRAAGLDVRTGGVRTGVFFATSLVRIGEGSMIARGCSFENTELVTVGRNCFLAAQVLLTTSTHKIGAEQRRAGDLDDSSSGTAVGSARAP
jgi:acetyltransferase-like isoleucine patch superfamily enzyme